MTRGVGDVEGWPAVAPILATYRTAGAPGSMKRANTRHLAIFLVSLCALSQLLYVALYIELAQWLLGARERPRLSGDLFFLVLLVVGTFAGASLYTGWKKSD